MKGQVAVILLILFLVVGILIFLVLSLVFVPLLKAIVTTPILEQPAVGAITALLGFLPEQCSSLTSLDCRFCLITEKIVPLVANVVFGIILFSVILRFVGGPLIDWEERIRAGERSGLIKGPVHFYSAVLLISIAFSIFMLHQPNPLVYFNWMTMVMAIAVRIITFMVTDAGTDVVREHMSALRRLTDFFLGANILISGWTNLWFIPIVFIAGITFVTTIVQRGNVEGPRMHITQWNLGILTIILLSIGFYLYAVFEYQLWTPFGTLPTKIEYPGLAGWIKERFPVGDIKCGENIIGPESSISI